MNGLSAKTIIKSPNKTLLVSCFSFLLGVAVSSLLHQPIAGPVAFGMLGTMFGLLAVFWKSHNVRLILLALLCTALGYIWYALHVPVQTSSSAEQTFTATVAKEPDVRQGSVRYVLESEDVRGGVYVYLQPYPRYQYGDVLSVTCKLKQPEPIEDFQYDKYLLSQGAAWQ